MRHLLVVTVVCVTAVVSAQQPTFRSEINYVRLPVRVLDNAGEFVSGLTQSDFQILEDGQPQTIATFTAVDLPLLEPGGTDRLPSLESIETDGRVYVFVLDNQTMGAATSLRTRHLVRGFIRHHLKANDLAAVVMTGTGRGQPPTRNRQLLDEALNRFMSDGNPIDHALDRILVVIGRTAEWMGSIQGGRKALVLVTQSYLCSMVEIERSEISTCNEGLSHTLRKAMESDVTIYTVDPRGAVATHGAPAEESDAPGFQPSIVRGLLDGARYLADESGGFPLINTNSLSAGFARIAREMSSYYLITYYSTNSHADGKRRKNVVTVSRPGVRVIHRPGYLGPALPSNP